MPAPPGGYNPLMTDQRGPEEGRDRLEQLEEDIEEARRHTAKETGEDEERHFKDRGSEGPVDDTIVPPG
jgi:hypothetical protein